MFESPLHRRVALAIALAALALTGVSAGAIAGGGAIVGTPVSTSDVADASLAEPTLSVASSETAANGSVSATIVHDGPLVVRAAPNQTVRVKSNAPAGTEMTVRLSSGRFNLLKASQVTVGSDGTATATFNLSGVEPGTTFTATVSEDAETEVTGVVVNASATVHPDASFTVTDPALSYTIRGKAIDPAVSRLDVRYSSEGATPSEPKTVEVSDDGTFEVSLDLSSLDSGTEISVEVGGIPRSVNQVVVTDEGRPPTVYAVVEQPANATIHFPEETLLVHPEANQIIHGTTNLRPGTEIEVRAVNDERNSPNGFSRSVNVTVNEDGTFAAALNFSGVEPGTNFSLTVGPGLTTKSGRVVNESVEIPTVTATASTTTVNETDVPFTTNSTTATTGDETHDEHTDEFGVPGFGIPAALVAVLAALALVRRQ